MPYTTFLVREAADALRTLRSTERDQVIRLLDFLEEFPSTKGDTFEQDSVGRRLEVKILGRIKAVYWPDHAVKEVKVLQIKRV